MRYSHPDDEKTQFETSDRAKKTAPTKRAEEPVVAIVEAAARILEATSFVGFNTNAVAEKAGVSIASLYQYFPDKDAILSAVIEREVGPLSLLENKLRVTDTFAPAPRRCLQAAIAHQERRPRLARLIDSAERREMFDDLVRNTEARLMAIAESILTLPDAPAVVDRSECAADLIALTRGLVDAASRRGEIDAAKLLIRLEGAVWGYLNNAG